MGSRIRRCHRDSARRGDPEVLPSQRLDQKSWEILEVGPWHGKIIYKRGIFRPCLTSNNGFKSLWFLFILGLLGILKRFNISQAWLNENPMPSISVKRSCKFHSLRWTSVVQLWKRSPAHPCEIPRDSLEESSHRFLCKHTRPWIAVVARPPPTYGPWSAEAHCSGGCLSTTSLPYCWLGPTWSTCWRRKDESHAVVLVSLSLLCPVQGYGFHKGTCGR